MILYEATNGYYGQSYVRCYVLAHDEEEALRLAAERNPGFDREWKLEQLLTSDSEPFATIESDTGWALTH